MEGFGSALGFDFDRAGAVAAILRAVVRSQNLEFGDGINAGIDVQRAVAAVVHVVAAVEFPVVVLGAAAVHAESDAAVDADLRLVHSGLVAHAGDEGHQRGEVSAVEFELGNFFSRDRAGEFGGLGLDLGDVGAFDDDFGGGGADFEVTSTRAFSPTSSFTPLASYFLKPSGGDDDVIRCLGAERTRCIRPWSWS